MLRKAKNSNWMNIVAKPMFYLAIIVILGGLFRFYNLDWDFKHSFHPDERNILGQTASIQATDGYRVHFFAYGQLPVYLYRFSGELVSTPAFLISLFHGNTGLALWFYWIGLGVLSLLLVYFLLRTDLGYFPFIASAFLLIALLLIKLYPIFNLWFEALEGIPLKLGCFFFVLVISFGVSAYWSYFEKIEWFGTPLYISSGIVFLLGIIPAFLPDAFGKAVGALAFTLTVVSLSIWWAWVSRVGRTLLGLLAFWSFCSALDHSGYQFTDYGNLMMIGRWWAAVFSTATILAIYFFVNKAYRNNLMALLAAACFSFAVVSIEEAHYCITESFITLMMVVIAYLAYEIAQSGSWKYYLISGAAFGLSMAGKTSCLYYVFIILTGHLVFLAKTSRQEWIRIGKKEKENRGLYSAFAAIFLVAMLGAFVGVGYKFNGVIHDLFNQNITEANILWGLLFGGLIVLGIVFTVWGALEFKVLRAQMPEWGKMVVVGALGFLIFCLLSPWSLLDFNGFTSSMNYEWHVVSIADACYVLQFKDTLRYIFQLYNLVAFELWWPLGITVVLGMFWALGRLGYGLLNLRKTQYLLPAPFVLNKGYSLFLPDLLILCWFIPYFGFVGAWNTKFIRYMVPLIPAFCILGAELLVNLIQWFKSKVTWSRFLKPILIVLVIGPSLFYSLAYMHVYRYLHPWIQASLWIFKNVPRGSVILNENWDDGLPTGVDQSMVPSFHGSMGPQDYQEKNMDIYELYGNPTDDTPVKKNYYANIIQQGDYICIPTKKLWYTLTDCTPEFRPHGFNIYPVTSRFFRLLWSGLLGYKMVAQFHNFPSLLGWVHPDDMAEETFSVYDHPVVYIFKKIATVPPATVVKLLSSDAYVEGINRNIMRTITPANLDAFLAQRHDYLEKMGLLQALNENAPTTVSAPQVAPKPPPLVSRHKSVPPNAVSPASVNVEAPPTVPGVPGPKVIAALESLAQHPVIETSVPQTSSTPQDTFLYQARAWISWLFILIVLGWMALPMTLRVMPNIASGAYSLSKFFGFLIFSWLVWFFTCVKICRFTIGSCWIWFLIFLAASLGLFFYDKDKIKTIFLKNKKYWLFQEIVFICAFIVFTVIKMYCSHIHDPVGEGYNGGGEAGMDFGFLASIVRGDTFPPQDMWMAGVPIGYTFYFGHLMMGVLTKTLGLVPAITYNLALITLFAAIFSGAYGIAFGLSGRTISGLIAGFLCAVAGNLGGAKQYLDVIHQCFLSDSLSPLLDHVFDFWGPTRVIPHSINEFPFFSVLYGDMHAHTLAMPFAILLIGGIASFYLSPASKPFQWKTDWLTLLFFGFLFGSITFLNTWEVPTWMVLLILSQLVRNFTTLSPQVIKKGFVLFFGILLFSLILLGWWGVWEKLDQGNQALGGGTGYLAVFLFLGILAGIIVLMVQKTTRVLSRQIISLFMTIVGVLAVAGLLWLPYFTHFSPQQNEVMWVPEYLRTSIMDFVTIYGLFVFVLAFAFLPGCSKAILDWAGTPYRRIDLADFVEDVFSFCARVVNAENPVLGMFSLGLAFLMAIYVASWAHWTQSPLQWLAQLLATFIFLSFFGAIYFKKKMGFWATGAGLVLIWIVLMVLKILPLADQTDFLLGLGLFSILWLTGFIYLGLSAHNRGDRTLSFTYILTALFFLVLAALEIFAMHEYLGGDYMRNNSLFKFGINAWTLASISAGVFIPRIYSTLKLFLGKKVKESRVARSVCVGVAGFVLFMILWFVLESFSPSFDVLFVHLANMVLLIGLLVWAWTENWIKNATAKFILAIAVGMVLIFPLVAMFPPMTGLMSIFERWGSNFSSQVLFPLILTLLILVIVALNFEKEKNLGQHIFYHVWTIGLVLLLIMVSVYPVAATIRKCHGFFGVFQKQWIGYVEPPTLNGLAYIPREDPYDAAAIHFLNTSIPGQPCLVEFVGTGYNTWGSRFSIFTGIPALMGWDGHVREWIGDKPGADEDISQRFQATQEIYQTTDPVLAKKYLDAYGVRLVMVGTLERDGVPGLKPGYPEAGLDKFSSFLPLIYKNPQVEIYYNPPAVPRVGNP